MLESVLEFADQFFMAPIPKGPAGNYRFTYAISKAIPEYCENKELAGDLLKYLLKRENFVKMATDCDGFTQPMFEGLMDVAIWNENPNLQGYEPVVEDYLTITGWPGPLSYNVHISPVTVRTDLQAIMPIMFAKVVYDGATPDEAMAWAQTEIERIVEEESQ